MSDMIRLTLSCAVAVLIFPFPVSAIATGSIPIQKLDEIRACAKDKKITHAQQHRLPWRTHTHYMAADNTSFSIALFGYSACRQVSHSSAGDENGTTLADHVNSPGNGQVVEGQLLTNGQYAPLDMCGRYKFIPPATAWQIGDEKHEAHAGLSPDGMTLGCSAYTEGAGFLKGGGHVYSVCSAIIEPVLNDEDFEALFKICAKELLR